MIRLRGFEKLKQLQFLKKRDNYGVGTWVGPGLTRNVFLCGKLSQNSPIPVHTDILG